MSNAAALFGLFLSNIPIVNLRQEFSYYQRSFADPSFRARLPEERGSVFTDYAAFPTKQALFTHVVQRAVLGVESYLPFAATTQAYCEGSLTEELFKKVRNPFALEGRGTVAKYYDRLPSLVKPHYSLRLANPHLYQTTARFYRELRNPLFHGHEIQNDENGTATLATLNFVGELYRWIDSWCPPSNIGKRNQPEQPAPVSNAEYIRLSLRIPKLGDP